MFRSSASTALSDGREEKYDRNALGAEWAETEKVEALHPSGPVKTVSLLAEGEGAEVTKGTKLRA